MKKKISLIGLGFSGLSLAWALSKEDYEIEIFEKSERPGGLLKTFSSHYGLVEPAANAILCSENVELMAKDFGIEWAGKKKTSKKRWIYCEDRPKRWPLSFMDTAQNLIPLFGVARSNINYAPFAFESLEQWGSRVFKSEKIVQNLLGPALQGVYAQGPENLSACLSLKNLFSKKRIKTSGSVSPKEGMRQFFSLGEKFLKKQKNIKLSYCAEKLRKDIDADLIIDTSADYMNINYIPVISVTLFFKIEDRPKFEGFGCLFAGSKKVLGVLFNSDIFEGRCQDAFFSETWILQSKKLNEAEALKEVLDFRDNKFKSSSLPLESHVTFWPTGIPDYSVSHEKYLAQNLQKDFQGGLKSYYENKTQDLRYIRFNNAYGNIGLNKILESSVELVKDLKNL